MFIKPEFGKVVEGVIEVTNEITASLALDNIRRLGEKLDEKAEEKDPAILKLAQALIHTEKMKKLGVEIQDEFSRLTDESEKLIDSPEADTPEVLARRSKLKTQMNELLEVSLQITKENEDLFALEDLISTSSVEDVAEAREFLNECQQLVEININPKLGSN
jgi:hypothetical protein